MQCIYKQWLKEVILQKYTLILHWYFYEKSMQCNAMQLKFGSMQCMSMHWFFPKLTSKSRKNQCIDDQGPHSGFDIMLSYWPRTLTLFKGGVIEYVLILLI